MSLARATAFIETTLEGPYHVTAGDPGGPTAYGIALAYHPELTEDDIRNMTPGRAATIITQQYWPKGADALPGYLATPLLAFCVLAGKETGVMVLQQAMRLPTDGNIGPQTIAAAAAANEWDLLREFFESQMRHLIGKSGWGESGVGWMGRAFAAALFGAQP